ncbi:mpv17-like protein 2 [Epargyreus clarus]|uniref:mpv17-like protein 2 n=1 Tax=Epargyreus clarus TaxID=520877 RepID=UPI003C307E35
MKIRRLLSKTYSIYQVTAHKAFSPKYLLYTNVLLSIGISTAGDIMEQCYEWHVRDIDSFDTHRTGQMAVSGCTAGIICHNWYNFLDKVIIGRTFDMVIKKLLLDQFICSPVVILSFFATVAVFEDNPLENFNDEVKEKFWTLYRAEWLVWPPAQIINFYFLPTKYRVVYDNTISLGYDIYTSHVKHQKTPKEADNTMIEKA